MARRQDEDARQPPAAPISRRAFIEGVVAASTVAGGAAVTARAAGGDASGAAPAAGDAAALEVLTREQGRLLAAVLNRLIPADGVMPAAGDAGMTGYIDQVLLDAPRLRRPVIGLLGELHGGGFARLADPEQDARLRRVAADRPESFEVLLHAAYTGYYSDPGVLAAAGWAPAGAAPPAAFDRTLLDAVRRRGPIYRDV